MIKVSPSVLSCDLSRLSDAVREVELAGADMVHLDVMDGMFVNNLTFGIPVIRSLRDKTDLTFDVHLMIVRPERYIEKFIEASKEKETQVIFLEVRASNLPAINLYEGVGFVFCGIRKDYYDDPKENAILMRLAFDGTQEFEEWDDD